MEDLLPLGEFYYGHRSQILLQYESLLGCEDIDLWKCTVADFLYQVGGISFLFSIYSKAAGNNSYKKIITNFPDEWMGFYQSERLQDIDPIVKHNRKHIKPLYWDFERSRSQGEELRFWKHREEHGIQHGVTINFQVEPYKGYFCACFSQLAFRKELLGELSMFIPFALESFISKFCGPRKYTSCLTLKETECLQWAAAGKTSWEIGRILRSSERTVNFHIGNVLRKLMVSNRQEAIALALSLGLISV